MIKMGPVHIFGLLWMILYTFPLQIFASGAFELKLNSFRNQFGLNSDNNCCSGVKDHSGYCTESCRTFFKICLKEYQTHIVTDSPKCTFGSVTTPVVGANTFNIQDSSSSSSSNTQDQLLENPIKLHFEFSWPGTFSLIIEVLHDLTNAEPTQGSPRELIIRLAKQGDVTVGNTWQDESYLLDNKKLDYSYRVVCDDSYYGVGCADLCKARDDIFGHYTCNPDGTKICMDGWSGNYCDRAICLPGCHAEHGSCQKPNECKCNIGYEGKDCDLCISYPGCQHGTCQQPWQCNCAEGWGGLFCNQDLNYCTHNKPCKNGASCTNTGQGWYTCECAPGYSGTECEVTVNNCQQLPCKNGGTCTQKSAEEYTCQCPEGYQGEHCQSSFSSCDENPCQHGTCESVQSGSMTYKCTCSPGYSGVNCEIEVDDCSPNPCENGGRCVDERNGFRCVCSPGYSGETCQENTNDCSINPCLNGATCIDHINEFKCRCVTGYQGDLCQENIDECDMAPCANGGICHDSVNDFICDCGDGFGGKDCRVNINECENMPCQNGGECSDLVNDYSCSCIGGYHGKSCEFSDGETGYPDKSTTSNGGVVPVIGKSTTPSYHTADVTTTTDLTVNAQPRITQDKSIITLQVTLYICLGVGIPCLIIIGILVFLLFRRWRNHREDHPSDDTSSSVQKDNELNEEANMNNRARNKTKSLESDILAPSSVSLKITNEEQQGSSTRTNTSNPNSNNLNTTKNKIHHKNNLNIDQNIVSKLYPKELNVSVSKSKDYRHLNSRDLKDSPCSSHSSNNSNHILDSNNLVTQQQQQHQHLQQSQLCGLQQGCLPVLSTLESPSRTDISDHHHNHLLQQQQQHQQQQPQQHQMYGQADVHVVKKTSNNDSYHSANYIGGEGSISGGGGGSSIYYLEKNRNNNPHIVPQYTEGVLATEV